MFPEENDNLLYNSQALICRIALEISLVLDENTVFLCLGSDKCIYDCFGPLTGSFLSESPYFKDKIYGTINNPVNAMNLSYVVAQINKRHRHNKLFVIDASLGKKENIGSLLFKNQPLIPAAATGKGMDKIGNFSLTGTVGARESFRPDSVGLGFIASMAKNASMSILLARQNAFYASVTSCLSQ